MIYIRKCAVFIFPKTYVPALAVRAGYSNLSNLEDLDSDNYSGALTASWGYKKVIAFGSLQLNLSLMSGYEEAENDVYFSSTQNIGFQYNISHFQKLVTRKAGTKEQNFQMK